jgi:cytoskeletal protein CcmA (bactofilin family)
LIVEESACLNSGRVICGEALIEGKLNGSLLCEGALHLACKAKLAHGVTAGSVIIEKNANVELLQPVKTAELIVHGRASGRFECTGRVTISKRGILEGRLVARSVVVERGGSLLAESSIKSGTPTEANHPISTGPKDSAGGFASGPPLPAY